MWYTVLDEQDIVMGFHDGIVQVSQEVLLSPTTQLGLSMGRWHFLGVQVIARVLIGAVVRGEGECHH